MKLTDYEKEVIYRALDNYIVLLSSNGYSKADYEIKTAKEIRKAIHTPKPTDGMTDAEKLLWISANTNYGKDTSRIDAESIPPWPDWSDDKQTHMAIDADGLVVGYYKEPIYSTQGQLKWENIHGTGWENYYKIDMTGLDWRKCIRKRVEV